jgi:DNA-binding NarL/FixJ family response regulator
MIRKAVIIASNAGLLVDVLREKLQDVDLRVFVVASDVDLAARIKSSFPRLIFLENCYHGHRTDVFIQRLVKHDKGLRIAVWSASELKPASAARFIIAGAESFFSLRDTVGNIETILACIARGKQYYPADVEAVVDKEYAVPLIGESLTKREIEIIKLTIDGKTNLQIADDLSISFHAVRFHKSNIYRKCGGSTPVDILRNGLVNGVISIEDIV